MVTRAIGVRAIRAGLAGAVGGFEEAWVARRAAGLHARGGQLHSPLEILGTNFRLGPFVHELRLQKWIKNGSACAQLTTSLGKLTEDGEILGYSESSTRVSVFVLVIDVSLAPSPEPGTWLCSVNAC